jgi:hypothetical protein
MPVELEGPLPSPEFTPQQAEFIHETTVAATIATEGRTSVNKITIDMIAAAKSIEIQSIRYNEEEDYIGQGGFGIVFKAKWDGVVNILRYYQYGFAQASALEPVAIKRIHEEDTALSSQEGHMVSFS